jgi:hypothetical protein
MHQLCIGCVLQFSFGWSQPSGASTHAPCQIKLVQMKGFDIPIQQAVNVLQARGVTSNEQQL